MLRFTCVLILLSLRMSAPTCWAQPAQQAISVSMLQLIATPEQFNGKLISVIGFVTLDKEGDLLFAHQEDAVHWILGNAIQVAETKQMFADREKLDQKYVKIIGIFRASDRHRIPFYSGTIEEIGSCDLWSDPAHPISQRFKERQGPAARHDEGR
jgi:hypothetical protein